MRDSKRKSVAAWFVSLFLLVAPWSGILSGDRARAQSLLGGLTQTVQSVTQIIKVSPDLLGLVLGARVGERVDVIVQTNGPAGLTLDLLLGLLGGLVKADYRNLNARAVNIPAASVLELAASLDVAYVSPDRGTSVLGHVSATTGADAARAAGGGSTATPLDGTGVGIAVIDSGIDSAHKSFLDRSNNRRVVFSRDFTGEGRTDDPYGHGTHVAALAAGNGRISNGAYTGVAPNASLVNLRVLDSRGAGKVSGLLGALDWLVANRTAYNVRVVNMSLGAPAVDSYKYDPVCRAVRKLVDKGVVVFAAAGNEGKDGEGQKTYGRIHAPGNEPSAVTVGAANTFGTDARSDDAVATYSSRGPTRSFWTERNGTRHYDNLVKPDLVAPGNKLTSAEAEGNLLVTSHPELDAGVSPAAGRRMMTMSGTSMATPVAAGAAALMLQANPKLTPNLVKALLMYTSQPLAGYNAFEQGAGLLNVEGAVRLARLVRTDLSSSTPLGTPLLVTSAPPSPTSSIAGQSFSWSQGLVLNYTYVTGLVLITKYQKFYGNGALLGDGVIAGDSVITRNSAMTADGVQIGEAIMTSSGVIAGDGYVFCAYGVLLGQGRLLDDGEVIGDGVIAGDGVIYGDGVIAGDGVIYGDTMMRGDDTSWMEAPVDDGTDFLAY